MRIAAALAGAVLVNLALFAWIHAMTAGRPVALMPAVPVEVVDFVRVREPQQRPAAPRRREPPPAPEPPPPEPAEPAAPADAALARTPLPLPLPRMDLDLPLAVGAGPYLGPAAVDGPPAGAALDFATDPTLIVGLPPSYPPTARMRRIEGFVEVELVITREGRVRDPVVLDASPPGVFDRAALRAVRRWRFEPERRGGEAVEVRARQRIDFRLGDS